MRKTRSFSLLMNQALFAVACLLVVTIALFPASVMLSTALKACDDIFNIPQTWIPRPIAWRNLVDVWHLLPLVSLGRMFTNSLIVALGTTALTMLLVVPAAYAMAKAEFAGKQAMSLLLLTLQMFSPVVIILPLYRIMLKLHLLNTYWSLILMDSLFLSSFAAWLLMGFFEAIPRDLERAATMDGCSSLQLLTHIFLPLATPGLVVTAIYCFIGAWNEFFFAYTFMASDVMNPLMVGIYRQYAANPLSNMAPPWNTLMSASLYSIVPPIILFMLIRRHLVGGLTAGAMKM